MKGLGDISGVSVHKPGAASPRPAATRGLGAVTTMPVLQLQQALERIYRTMPLESGFISPGTLDGRWGPRTQAAFAAYLDVQMHAHPGVDTWRGEIIFSADRRQIQMSTALAAELQEYVNEYQANAAQHHATTTDAATATNPGMAPAPPHADPVTLATTARTIPWKWIVIIGLIVAAAGGGALYWYMRRKKHGGK